MDLHDINTRNDEEPIGIEDDCNWDNDLEEMLYSAKNMIDLALLALYSCPELVPTALEAACDKLQILVDDYCEAKK